MTLLETKVDKARRRKKNRQVARGRASAPHAPLHLPTEMGAQLNSVKGLYHIDGDGWGPAPVSANRYATISNYVSHKGWVRSLNFLDWTIGPCVKVEAILS